MAPIISHTRSSRGDNSSRPLRLQRIRRPGGGLPNKQESGRNAQSGRSVLFHQKSDGDMSDYQYSVAPELTNPQSDNDWDVDTVGDESMYTTAQKESIRQITPNLNLDGNEAAQTNHREEQMKLAGIDNSIPTNLVISGSKSHMGVSKLDMFSTRSMMGVGLDPTEEESQEGSNQQNSQEQKLEHASSQIQVSRIPEEHSTSFSPANEPAQLQAAPIQKKKKKGLFARIMGAIFKSKTKSRSNSANSKGKKPTDFRASMNKTPTELWNSTPAKNNNKIKRTNTGTTSSATSATTATTTTKMEPSDLWAPEQAAERGMPAAKLKMSTAGQRVWENASGRLVPFNAAEC